MFRCAVRPALLVVFVLFGVVAPARATEFVLNGSLEDLNSDWVNTAGNYMALGAGSSAIADWTVSPGTINQIVWAKSLTADGHNAANGTFFVDLTGFGAASPNGAIQQLLTGLVPGQSYSYSMDVEIVGLPPEVTVGGAGVALTPGGLVVVVGDVWTQETGSFIAGSPDELLMIANPLAGEEVEFIDNISVNGPSGTSSVPEPASMLLLGTGLIGMGARRWRNRRQRG